MSEELKAIILGLVAEQYRLFGLVYYEPVCDELVELTMPDPETIAMN